MPVLNLDSGKSVTYLDKGEGFPVLFGHSYLWNKEMWTPQVEALSTQFRCVVPDLWGHGESAVINDDDYSTARLADDYLEFMDKLGIKEFAVVGLSVGGMWGMELALKAQERVKALVMMDTYVGAEPQSTKLQYFGMLDMIEQLGCVPEVMADQIVPMFFSPVTLKSESNLPGRFKSMLQEIKGERVKTVVTLGRAIFGRPERLNALTELKSPLLVICGEDDAPRPVVEAQRMAEISGAMLKVIPQSGHIANLEQPELVNEILREFLSDLVQ